MLNLAQLDSNPRWRRAIYLRDLLRELVRREIKILYKSSVLGIFWSMLNPILQLMVFTFLFRVVVPLGIPNYAAFAFTGLLAWVWFQASMIQATGAITGHRDLIRRPGFPSGILPAITVTTNLINLLLALPLLVGFILITGGAIHTTIAALPFLMLLQFVLTLSFAYLLATANVLFRDTQHLITVLLQLTFYFTPIFYNASRVPEKYQPLYRLNPMVHLVEGYRDVLLYGRWPDGGSMLILSALAVALLVFGYSLFTWMSHRFVEEL
jgi:lipopolysaccharide transport system permease protein